MKKFLAIIILGLLWTGIAQAQQITFEKCFSSKGRSDWDTTLSKHIDIETAQWVKHISPSPVNENVKFVIDLENSRAAKIEIYTDSYTKDMIKYYKDLISKTKSEISKRVYEESIAQFEKKIKITDLAIHYIDKTIAVLVISEKMPAGPIDTAEFLETKDVLQYKVEIDLKELTFHEKTYSGNPFKIEVSYESKGKCEKKEGGSGSGTTVASSGSGFFINKKGYFITNYHVVAECNDKSKITFKEEDVDAKLIAKDESLDLALLRAKVKPKIFLYLSADPPEKIQTIYVAGYPFGKGLSDDLKITQGIISSLKGFGDNSNEIQIDAAINPGNSGGPIVNDDGELMAVAVSGLAKDQSEGINFGIKASSVKNFLDVNKAKYSTSSLMKFSMSNKKLNDILEESTVYTFCH